MISSDSGLMGGSPYMAGANKTLLEISGFLRLCFRLHV